MPFLAAARLKWVRGRVVKAKASVSTSFARTKQWRRRPRARRSPRGPGRSSPACARYAAVSGSFLRQQGGQLLVVRGDVCVLHGGAGRTAPSPVCRKRPFTIQADQLRLRLEGRRLPVAVPAALRASTPSTSTRTSRPAYTTDLDSTVACARSGGATCSSSGSSTASAAPSPT